MASHIAIECLRGWSAHRPVLLGFAPADLLYKLSFPDIFDEDRGKGYQRPFNERHSQDFRRYIKEPGSSTIPLTLNLRPPAEGNWRIVDLEDGRVRLEVTADAGKIMAQVDCQHRLGHLGDLPILLPFMVFVGLSEREEMEVFSIINSKAKGLSTSSARLPLGTTRRLFSTRTPRTLHRAPTQLHRRVPLVPSVEPRRQDNVWPEADRVASHDAAGNQKFHKGYCGPLDELG